MLRAIAAFELRYQRKSPAFWTGALLFFLFTFLATTVDQVQIGSRGGVNVNAPFAILEITGIMMLFATFIVVALVANVVIRDDETGFAPILRATSMTKRAYLVGRFTGATTAALGVVAAVPAGIAVGSLMPWLDPEKVGAFHLSHYAYALFAFALPTLLILSAAYFALATATRSMMWTYVGALGMLVLYLAMRALLRDPAHATTVALVDPFGLSALNVVTKYWTAAERNTQLPALTGLLLANRVLWTVIGLGLFGLAYRRFQFATRGAPTAGKSPHLTDEAAAPATMSTPQPLPPARADRATRRAQLWRLTRFDVAFVVRSPAFGVLLAIGVLNSVLPLWLNGKWYGISAYPVTRLMVQGLNDSFAIMPIVIAVFYGGELVWRDHQRKTHELVDATAAPDWTHLVPKIVAIAIVLAASIAVGVAAGIAVQLIKGNAPIELGAYASWFAAPTLVTALQLAVLSVVAQAIAPHKLIGWAIMLVYIVANIALPVAGFEHNLYNFANTTPVPLSDMNGTGHFWIARAWFELYWSAFAAMLAVAAFVLWRRGTTVALRPRLARARRRLRGWPLVLGLAATALWLGSGAVIYDNTNVINRYSTAPRREALAAQYEKLFLRYETLPQPQITSITFDIQLYPAETRAVTTGSYRLENKTAQAIDSLHVTMVDFVHDWLTLDRLELAGATLEHDWPEYGYRIYKLDPPMQPGEVRELRFATTLAESGFPNSEPLTRIAENGTFVDNSELAPQIGVNRSGLLKDRAKRRKYGLPPDLRPPTLEDDRGRWRHAFSAQLDWVTTDITVTTDADQTPIAPGYLVSDSTAAGRRTARFKSDAPILDFFSVQSARYAVKHDAWSGGAAPVQLAVYYHPDHGYNVDRMLAAMKTALTLFSREFAPYQFHQARILEFPAYARFAQSFANTIPYSEDIGFLANVSDPDALDVVTYVTAHEIAHQWWGHQEMPGDQQGATMLVESFAQYSAMLVVEQVAGPEHIRQFLKYELDRYLAARGGEVVEELPLARVENQPYIHYQKGSLAMYWLKDVVGQSVVDRALAKFLARYAFKPAPYPNSRDFLAILRAEAGPQYDDLITDLFEKITLVDAKATGATAVHRADGKWDVTIDVSAKKLYADGAGVETEAPLDELFDIGVFTAAPGARDFTHASVLYLAHHRIHTGAQTVTVTVDQRPAFAGIDPYNKRIDRNSDDNVTGVDVR